MRKYKKEIKVANNGVNGRNWSPNPKPLEAVRPHLRVYAIIFAQICLQMSMEPSHHLPSFRVGRATKTWGNHVQSRAVYTWQVHHVARPSVLALLGFRNPFVLFHLSAELPSLPLPSEAFALPERPNSKLKWGFRSQLTNLWLVGFIRLTNLRHSKPWIVVQVWVGQVVLKSAAHLKASEWVALALSLICNFRHQCQKLGKCYSPNSWSMLTSAVAAHVLQGAW